MGFSLELEALKDSSKSVINRLAHQAITEAIIEKGYGKEALEEYRKIDKADFEALQAFHEKWKHVSEDAANFDALTNGESSTKTSSGASSGGDNSVQGMSSQQETVAPIDNTVQTMSSAAAPLENDVDMERMRGSKKGMLESLSRQ